MSENKNSKNSRRQFFATAAKSSLVACTFGLPLKEGISNHFLKGSSFEIKDPEKTSWLTINGELYGAKPNDLGPIGGGEGYTMPILKGDFEATNLDELLDALAQAKSGQVVYIPDETKIDLTTRVYIDKLILEIPAGVTLAGNRGYQGSKGGLLLSNTLNTSVMIRPMGPNVRFSGLRIQGPNPDRHLEHHKRSFGPNGLGRDYYYKFPVSRGIVSEYSELQVDNCEISAFSGSGIYLKKGSGHYIHHNFIHKCQYNGLGYGVSHGAASSITEYNLFNENRHSIAGTGISGCGYIARHNVEMGISLSHCFDMHGGRDRKDGSDIAGTTIEIYNNTFYAPQTPVVIRGIPEDKCDIFQNWFAQHKEIKQAVKGLSEKTRAINNVYVATVK
ncbi:right-handed parallel beta-helix repeat-containing protein [uncultured Cyclobacterium sp.]|uniref:right-handed parallel beta-helix repeat-containing protein n=1 Tax=uncultured Cyclobacterium sp. TaxID=453820 RepID=UPI0030EDEC52